MVLVMRGRTFLRIMLENIFINNTLSKTIIALVNFCNEQSYYGRKKLKFLNKMPLNNTEEHYNYKNKFIFTNNQNSGVNYK